MKHKNGFGTDGTGTHVSGLPVQCAEHLNLHQALNSKKQKQICPGLTLFPSSFRKWEALDDSCINDMKESTSSKTAVNRKMSWAHECQEWF